MTTWGLACKNCRATFTHSQIPDTLADYFLPTRPVFPPEGLRCECLNCKAESTYRDSSCLKRNSHSARLDRWQKADDESPCKSDGREWIAFAGALRCDGADAAPTVTLG